MVSCMVDNVRIEDHVGLDTDEIREFIADEKQYLDKNQNITKLEIKAADDGHVEIKTYKSGNIKRIRRICGYCVNMDNWNQAKLDELSQRYKHIRT